MKLPAGWIVPDWPAPARVRAFVTTRAGGVSEGEYGSLNLGMKSGDDPARVAANRLAVRAHLPSSPHWLAQVHGNTAADLDMAGASGMTVADAAATSVAGRVAVVLTADCLPVFLCREDGSRVAVAHAGWRGLAAGVLENAVIALGGEASRVLAWLGPAIGPAAFEVGPEVREAFVSAHGEDASAFTRRGEHKFMADLYALARLRLARAGVGGVSGGGFCTWTESRRFFSYRRVRESGRMGAFIWIDEGR
ncbi:MAG TPA: peptidoglycan editing factor PgeF [Usitatibacteraceae bacterium]|nr:peptidoglycan editing factor PgeF [Usitatibacteraceae bacterium]